MKAFATASTSWENPAEPVWL